MTSNALRLSIPPVVLLGLAIYLALYPQRLPPSSAALLEWAPIVLPLAGAGLCLWFRKVNPVFCLLIVAFHHYFLLDATPTQTAGTLLLIPLAWTVLAITEERGLFTLSGLIKGASLLVAGLLLAALDRSAASFGMFANAWIDLHYALHWRPGWLSGLPLPFPALLAFLLGTLILTVRVIIRGLPMDVGYLSALVALLGAALRQGEVPATPLFNGLAAALVILAMFQESYRMAFLDELTGLPGRRALLADMKKLGRHYSVAMVDVDFFKKFNDSYGHDVGDQVLRMVASRLYNTGGRSRAYRYGGEEFTLLFPGKDADEAEDYLEDLRERIATSPFIIRSVNRPKRKPKSASAKTPATRNLKRVRITVSIGLADRQERQEQPFDVMKNADQALYKAKKKGRNRVIAA